MIEFLCPNGHKIRCQAAQAGKAAKCPRCGVRFRVPDATDQNLPENGRFRPERLAARFHRFERHRENRPQHRPHGQEKPISSSSARTGIVCMAPRAFRDDRANAPTAVPASASPLMRIFPPKNRPSRKSASAGRMAAKGRISVPGDGARRGVDHPAGAEATEAMFARLGTCVRRERRSSFGCEAARPSCHSSSSPPRLRKSRHGVFATVEADATVSLIVIPWDAVDRMTIRGLSEVPKELAE